MIESEKCTGCSACSNICPKNAIEMKYNDDGFLHPIIEQKLCINCGLCDDVCPVLIKHTNPIINAIAAYTKDEETLKKSSSGGVAASLYKSIIKRGGVCYGVAYKTNNIESEFIRFQSLDDLTRVQSSKYIQSDKKFVFRNVKEDLLNEKLVLFIGLPCEVAALKMYLKIAKVKTTSLFCVDLICHGPTSPMVARKFITENLKHKAEDITYLNVRYKNEKWEPAYMKCVFNDGKEYLYPFFKTDYGRAFGIYSRESCYTCNFKGDNSFADATIGDYWGATEDTLGFNKLGTSIVFIRDSKIMSLINDSNLCIFDADLEFAIRHNPRLISPKSKGKNWIVFKKSFIKGKKLNKCVFKSLTFKGKLGYTKNKILASVKK